MSAGFIYNFNGTVLRMCISPSIAMCRNVLRFSSSLHSWPTLSPHLKAFTPAYYLTRKTHNSKSTQLDQFNDTIFEWRTIYQLPLIRWASAFNRLKIYQGMLTVFGAPVAFSLEQTGSLGAHAGVTFISIGITGFITLCVGSLLAQNLVGFIYINDTDDKVKLAYVDFWGRRKEANIDVEDLVLPLEEERPMIPIHLYKNISIHSDAKRKYKLLTQYGVVLEGHTYVNLFGE